MTRTDAERANYTEHEKLTKIKDESQSIGAFLEWLRGDRGLVVASYHSHTKDCGHIPRNPVNYPADCGYVDDQLRAEHLGIQELLAEYFEISLLEIEQEKRKMLEELRKDEL